MKNIYLLIFFSLACIAGRAQSFEILPRYLTDHERSAMPTYSFPAARGIETPPPFSNLRTMAEWEEIQALTITWTGYPSILKQIVRAAKESTRVIVFCSSTTSVTNYLMGSQAGGPLNNMDNIDLVIADFNSVWMRDYGANTVYGNRVDSIILVDWIYNRPRPADDVIPEVLANHLGVNLYSTTSAPSDLVNTGGNFMSDGQGTAFASELILEENEQGNPYQVSVKTESEIDQILTDFQGIARYIKMTALQYDIINHIDMHIKLLDERTLLVGEYPAGVADGPQINANIDYVVNTFLSYFSEDFKVVRIPMPDSPGGNWPDSNPSAYYRTYSNGVFVNNTYIYPTYREQYDTTAARIYSELLPGYILVPIDCDNNPDNIIAAAGAIHCITHSVGVADPLLITHNPLADTYDDENPYTVIASAEHRSGVANANLFWRVAGDAEFNSIPMTASSETNWEAAIPAQAVGSMLEYFVQAEANSGKVQTRPIVAPEGFWKFEVLGEILGVDQVDNLRSQPVYPNPANGLVSIPISTVHAESVEVYLSDLSGKKLDSIYRGVISGERRLSYTTDHLASGAYLIVIEGAANRRSQLLMVDR